jgi:hypothetical protein
VYRDIPLPSWQVVYPDKLLQFRPLDLLRLDLFGVAGATAALAQAKYNSIVLQVCSCTMPVFRCKFRCNLGAGFNLGAFVSVSWQASQVLHSQHVLLVPYVARHARQTCWCQPLSTTSMHAWTHWHCL